MIILDTQGVFFSVITCFCQITGKTDKCLLPEITYFMKCFRIHDFYDIINSFLYLRVKNWNPRFTTYTRDLGKLDSSKNEQLEHKIDLF